MLWFLWLSYVLVTALLISNHAPWHDEAFVWLIAREVPWAGIYKEAGIHNAPSLWYYILAVPAKLGCPYWVMQFLHWVGACLATGIFLFWAPFSIVLKALFIFSYYIAYEHAVIARVYMPTLLLMWSACGCYSRRYERPVLYGIIVVLLANTSLYGLFAAGFLGVDFVISRRDSFAAKQWVIVGFMFLGCLWSANGLIPSKNLVSYYTNLDLFFRPNNMWDMFYFAYLAPKGDYYFSKEIQAALKYLVPWLGALYGAAALWLLKRWKDYTLMLFLSLAWLLILYLIIFKYPWPAPRHFSFCLIYTIMALWLGKLRCRAQDPLLESFLGILLAGSFLWSVLGTVVQGFHDVRVPFSGAKKMADYLIEHNLDNKVFVVRDVVGTAGILPYLPKASLWDPGRMEAVRYPHFDRIAIEKPDVGWVLSLVDKKFTASGTIYLLTDKGAKKTDGPRLKFLHRVKGQVEDFRLYSVVQTAEEPVNEE